MSGVSLAPPSAADADELIEAARASRSLPHPWIDPPGTAAQFAAYLELAARDDQATYLLRHTECGGLIGYARVSQSAPSFVAGTGRLRSQEVDNETRPSDIASDRDTLRFRNAGVFRTRTEEMRGAGACCGSSGKRRAGSMVIGMATKKVTVTLDEGQLDRIRALVGSGTASSVSGFVQHAVSVALDDVAGWGAMLADALRDTGGELSSEEQRWADEMLGVTRRHKTSAA